MKKLNYAMLQTGEIKIKKEDRERVQNHINSKNELTYDEYNRVYNEAGEYIADIIEYEKDYFNGIDWVTVDDEFLEGLANIEDIDKIYATNDGVKVVYEDGDEVYYQDVHGSWGFAYRVE